MDFFEFAAAMEQLSPVKFVDDLINELEANPAYKEGLDEQWSKGVDGNDQEFPGYSYATELFIKYEDGPAPIKPKKAGEPYNLMWTGDLFGKTTVIGQSQGGDIIFKADSSSGHKSSLEELLKASGKPYDIFKLDNENMAYYILVAQEVAIDILNSNLKLK